MLSLSHLKHPDTHVPSRSLDKGLHLEVIVSILGLMEARVKIQKGTE